MSSNPLMMGYGGRDLLRTGTVWPAVGSLPRPVFAGCGQWPVCPAAPGPWRERIRGGIAGPPAWPPAYGVHDDALYKSTAFYLYLSVDRRDSGNDSLSKALRRKNPGLVKPVWNRGVLYFVGESRRVAPNERGSYIWHFVSIWLKLVTFFKSSGLFQNAKYPKINLSH